ncbi:hypothetical protein CPCC7001_2538 [Cyanobium sp. PCC 7001]|nr:hypothetical protein CPCC7001_2538 [Cyanobium sp. PCC 7001]
MKTDPCLQESMRLNDQFHSQAQDIELKALKSQESSLASQSVGLTPSRILLPQNHSLCALQHWIRSA